LRPEGARLGRGGALGASDDGGLDEFCELRPHLFAQLGHFSLQSCHLRQERLHLLSQGNHDGLDSQRGVIPVFFRNGQFRW